MRWFRRMMVLVAVVLVLTMFMMSTLSVFMIFVFVLLAVVFFGHRSSPQFEFSEHQYRKYIHCIP